MSRKKKGNCDKTAKGDNNNRNNQRNQGNVNHEVNGGGNRGNHGQKGHGNDLNRGDSQQLQGNRNQAARSNDYNCDPSWNQYNNRFRNSEHYNGISNQRRRGRGGNTFRRFRGTQGRKSSLRSANYNHQEDSANYSHQEDSANYSHHEDSANYSHHEDSANYSHHEDSANYNHREDQSYTEDTFPETNQNVMGPPSFYPHAHQIFSEYAVPEVDQDTSQSAEPAISLNVSTPAVQPAPEEDASSSSSSSEAESEDSVVQSLKKVVDNALLTRQTESPKEKPKEPETTANIDGKLKSVKEENAKKAIVKKEKPPISSSDSSTSSSSSSSSSDSSSSEEETATPEKSKNVTEDVIYLGQVERIENLVEDEEDQIVTKCALCDKSSHISFHCQMVCKNCNGKYHGLKDCPKPANLNIVFSNFLQFCIKQSLKYNPNAELTLIENMPTMSTPVESRASKAEDRNRPKRKHKSRSSETSGSSSRKRQPSTESSSSSDSSSSDVSSRRKRRKSGKSEDRRAHSTMPQFAVPYPAAFNPSFGFGPSGTVNPMLAFSHMMGFNPGSLEFRSKSSAKD